MAKTSTRKHEGYTIRGSRKGGYSIFAPDGTEVSRGHRTMYECDHAIHRMVDAAKAAPAAPPVGGRALEELRDAADRWLSDAVPGNEALHAEDAEQLRTVAGYLAAGDLEAARATVRTLDTIVRDQIPRALHAACGLKTI